MMNDYIPTLKYGAEDKIAPIPPHEAAVQTVIAQPWLKVEQTCFSDLEGTNFDREGNLWFVEAGGPASKLHKVNMETKEDIVVYEDPLKRAMSAVKPHKNGRIYIPSVGPEFEKGYVFSCNPDGTDYRVELEGHVVDDMCFDSKGGYYYTHMYGSVGNPIGGVYYVAPDGKTVTPFLDKMCVPNGVALSKDESVLWITESSSMRLLRVSLKPGGGPTDIAPFGVNVPYQFVGGGVCDSCEIDDDDNLYVSMYSQGRVMVFNKFGWLIGQVLLAGRENGDFLGVTHTAIRPGTNELYICTNDAKNGAWIFKAGAFAKASLSSYQFQ
ncbi:MAG: SMP-30/gluconolactonase/LRE family protein [Lachnospiraceae bacterium]|nr:SMP-30/gluconolactonase/LRE family protein [Lachnospiraceae bacterium]